MEGDTTGSTGRQRRGSLGRDDSHARVVLRRHCCLGKARNEAADRIGEAYLAFFDEREDRDARDRLRLGSA